MRERTGLEGYWQGKLELNPAIDVESPALIEQQFYVPAPWNIQIRHLRRDPEAVELSGVVKPLQNQNFRDIQRRFSEGTITLVRKISIPAERMEAVTKGRIKAFLVFEGSNYKTEVIINDKKAGVHEGGHLPFEFDVSSLISAGENEVSVTVDNIRRQHAVPQEQFNWMNYGGPYRPVYIEWRPSTFIQQASVFPGRDADGWYLDVAVQLSNSADAQVEMNLTSGTENVSQSLAVKKGRSPSA